MRATQFTESDPPGVKAFDILRGHGYKLLGSGADASVWTKNDRDVIKILIPEDSSDRAALDRATKVFLKFYEFCQQNQGYDNLPRFTDVGGGHHKTFTLDGVDYMLIGMEKLAPIPRYSFDEAMVWMLSDLVPTGQKWDSVLPRLTDPQMWENFSDGMPVNKVLSTLRGWSKLDAARWGVLYTLMALLYHTGRINKFGWDLHTENAMMRDDGTVVITDPWFMTETQ